MVFEVLDLRFLLFNGEICKAREAWAEDFTICVISEGHCLLMLEFMEFRCIDIHGESYGGDGIDEFSKFEDLCYAFGNEVFMRAYTKHLEKRESIFSFITWSGRKESTTTDCVCIDECLNKRDRKS